MRCFPWIQAAILTVVSGAAGWLHLSMFSKRAIIDSTIARHVAHEAAALHDAGENDEGSTGPSESPDQTPADLESSPGPESSDPSSGSTSDEVTRENPASLDPPGSFDLASMDEEIDVAQAKWIFDQGLADFIDARNPEEYEPGHITGAFSIPPRAIQSGVPGVIEQGFLQPGDRAIVVYCEGGDCDASHLVRDHLVHMGFGQRIFIMVDGFPAWAEAGYPTDTGPDPFAGGGGG